MSSSELPLVMVVGASGRTGSRIVEALLRENKFRIAAISQSASKPILIDFKSRGVTIHELDHSTASLEELKSALTGVDILISTTRSNVISKQAVMFDAAKAVGVKRVVPDDFASSAPPGVMLLHDNKLAIRDHLRKIQQPSTFIEIGLWKQTVAPFPASVSGQIAQLSRNFHGDGSVPIATTNLDNIGDHVVRIIQDERTINQTVFVHEAQLTRAEAWKIAERKCDDWPALQKLRVEIPTEKLKKLVDDAVAKNDFIGRLIYEYAWSTDVRGDNTVENATKLGALDYRTLYPDVALESFEDFTDKFYKNPPNM